LTVLTNARLVQGDQVVDGGWIRCEGERFAEVGRGHVPLDQHLSVGGRSSTAGSTPLCSWLQPGAMPATGHRRVLRVAHAAADAGARVATHLFDEMRPIHHREPGVVVALMACPTQTRLEWSLWE